MKGHIKVFQSGKFVEVYEYERPCISVPRTNLKGQKRVTKRYNQNVTRRADSIRRTTKHFRRLVRANLSTSAPPALLTLTIAAVVPFKTSRLYFREFYARLRYVFPGFRYIAVPEWQERGAIHFHCLVWGLPSFLVCACGKGKKHTCGERQLRAIQCAWQRGFCDIRATDGSPALARYLAKYMSKAMSDDRLFGQRAYCVSSGLVRPVSLSLSSAVGFALEEFAKDDALVCRRVFGTQFLGACRYSAYDHGLECG